MPICSTTLLCVLRHLPLWIYVLITAAASALTTLVVRRVAPATAQDVGLPAAAGKHRRRHGSRSLRRRVEE